MAKITDRPYLFIQIQPETLYMHNQWLKDLMGSTRVGDSTSNTITLLQQIIDAIGQSKRTMPEQQARTTV